MAQDRWELLCQVGADPFDPFEAQDATHQLNAAARRVHRLEIAVHNARGES